MDPPPPPPHGETPKSSGLPPGKYDIFIIPPHSSGSGFLYLPSLRPNVNSFAAGFASALILVVIGSALAPAVQAWWNSVKGAGGMGMILLMFAIGVGAWALGRIQNDGGPGPGGGTNGSPPSPDAGAHAGGHSEGYSNTRPNGYASGHAGGPPPTSSGPMPGAAGPKTGWQRAPPPPGATRAAGATSPPPRSSSPKPSTPNNAAKGAWEKAREETRKKEEERKKQEAEKKRREDLEKRLKEAREKEAREREAREKKAKEEADKSTKENAWKEAKERLEKLEKERAERDKSKPPPSTSYAFSAMGEKINPWPRGRPTTPPLAPKTRPSPSPSPTKQPAFKRPPPPPTAKTYLGTEEDAYSFRPYDKPKHPPKGPSSVWSESSYAASQSTAQTTPPSSRRGPYSTKDPDKIVIKAVYSFNNAFLKTPTSQLVSGVGSVTDGLILRITTEGLFIDDDVRGVPQREWDVKAWTMKLVEVWCPSFRAAAKDPASARTAASASHNNSNKYQNPVRRLWGMDNKEKVATSEESDALLIDMLQLCKDNCFNTFRRSPAAATTTPAPAAASSTTSRSSAYFSASSASSSSAASSSTFDDRSSFASDSAYGSSVGSSSSPSTYSKNGRTNNRGVSSQTGELKSARLHVLRASIRDQEGKKYLFVIGEEESWKVAVGLQRLRKGTQVRALGVSGMSAGDARSTLENLGWG